MTKQTSTRSSLLVSVIALVCCFAMLLGTTFAWFTDTVSSEGNTIQSGTLKVDLSHKTESGWISLKEHSQHKVFDYAHWEPGYTRVEALKVENLGTLALQYKLSLSIAPGSETLGPNGENLAEVIQVYYTNAEATPANYAEIKDTWTYAGTLSEVMNSPATFIGGQLTPDGEQGDEQLLTIALHMDETAGNEYQNLNVGNIYVNLVATQWMYESDAFDKNYDEDATFPGEFFASAPVSVNSNGEVDQATTVGEQDGIHAEVPAGVKMENGATELSLNIQPMGGSQANITLENGETKKSYDIHVAGVAEDNDVPMLITLPGFMKKGLNTTSVELYHVENGKTVAMTLVDNPVNHNEFSYNPITGTVVICTATFSEYVAVTDIRNPWEGTANTDWYNDTDTEFMLTTAEQLAGFGVLVDKGNAFEGKTIKLGADINLTGTDESGKIISFNPIGCGYVDSTINSDGVEGRAFMGTFDGQNHTISNLYQNGWDLGLSYCNLGGGLFASIANGTVKNLTIIGANIVMECVEQGILVGLSQGNCTYENIKVYDSKIANYQRATGGLIGEISPLNGGETTTITNVTIGSDVVVGSLWGDFDAPVGGVIGARWDDGNTTTVVMENVTIAARLDVYNDVTSSYQWYAYRRAGMLIGNTDTPPADGKNAKTATADFLTCTDVTVYYGDWVNYHYCEFTNYNSSWPWVRVEAGENCSAFSNPRYGIPTFDGVAITDIDHKDLHVEGDGHNELIVFNQLYGGGQGVYGQTEHTGVTTESYDYTVTYMDRGSVYKVDYETNDAAYTVDHTNDVPTRTESAFKAWVNAGGTKVESIPEGNTANYTLYDSWHSVYTARFVDQDGNVIYEEEFKTNQTELTYTPPVPDIEGGFTGEWETPDLQNAEGDITIHPVYNLAEGEISLEPIDSNNDGIVEAYAVVGFGKGEIMLVEIPGTVNGLPVTTIKESSFSSYEDLHSVKIPDEITDVGKTILAADWGVLDKGETITIYYEGSYEDWIAKEASFTDGWDNGLGSDSRVFFLNGTERVDPAEGYLEYTKSGNGLWLEHSGSWAYKGTVTSALKAEYSGTCDCDDCNGAVRPDAEYWEGVVIE